MNVWPILLRHGARNVRQGGYPFVFATAMIALGLFVLSTYFMALFNFQRLAGRAKESIGSVAFLDVKNGAEAEEIRVKIASLNGVAEARLVTPEAALDRLQNSLFLQGALLEGAQGIGLGWGVEITPDPLNPAEATNVEFVLRNLRGIDEVIHPGGEVERIQTFLSMLENVGGLLGALFVFIAIFVVSNTVKLTLFARSEEIAILKLVGATDAFVRIPFLIEGLVEGLLGAGIALVGVSFFEGTLVGILQTVLADALGSYAIQPLPSAFMYWAMMGGALSGTLGAAFSIGRFLRV